MRHVTSVLRNCGLTDDTALVVPKGELEFYLMRGAMIHKATVLHDQGILDYRTLDPRIKPHVEAWVRFREEIGGQIVASEYAVEHPKLGYRGTLDRIIRKSLLHRGWLLLEIKTTEAPAWAALQTMAYSMAYKASRPRSRAKLKRGAVALTAEGKWKFTFHPCDVSDRAAWMACLKLDAWKERCKR